MSQTSPGQPAALSPAATAAQVHAPLSVGQFVAVMAALMALNALAIDIMLPALPHFRQAFALADANAAQTVITAYLVGFGVGQVFMGVLSDRFGRRPILLAGLLVYGLAAIASAVSTDMTALLVARFIQGLGSAAPRVVGVAAVRDCYGGRQMARVMSLVMMVFMAMPILAPSIGQLILLAAPWQAIFAVLAVYAAVMFVVCWRWLPETLRPEWRRAIRPGPILQAGRSIFGSRQTVGYTLASGAFFGALLGFVNSAQQLLGQVFGLGDWFPLAFAVLAGGIAVSSFINALLVERMGMRSLSHGATLTFLAVALTMLALALTGWLTVWTFMPLQVMAMLLAGLVFANFNALAMEPQQKVAGIASSLIGAVTILIGAGGGFLIGQAFDGSATPLALGFTVSASATLIVLLVTERGRLCRSAPVTD
ncbi:MAG: multidrug effflux MFS transporter [Alphaproteobacteria bacterium]